MKNVLGQKAKNLNEDENKKELDENFSSIPFMKESGSRPRKNLLTNSKNIPSQTKRKNGGQESKYIKMNYQNYMRKKEAKQN